MSWNQTLSSVKSLEIRVCCRERGSHSARVALLWEHGSWEAQHFQFQLSGICLGEQSRSRHCREGRFIKEWMQELYKPEQPDTIYISCLGKQSRLRCCTESGSHSRVNTRVVWVCECRCKTWHYQFQCCHFGMGRVLQSRCCREGRGHSGMNARVVQIWQLRCETKYYQLQCGDISIYKILGARCSQESRSYSQANARVVPIWQHRREAQYHHLQYSYFRVGCYQSCKLKDIVLSSSCSSSWPSWSSSLSSCVPNHCHSLHPHPVPCIFAFTVISSHNAFASTNESQLLKNHETIS